MDYQDNDKSINHSKDLENVLDKVLWKGKGLNSTENIQNQESNERQSLSRYSMTRSGRRLSQGSQKSFRSTGLGGGISDKIHQFFNLYEEKLNIKNRF